MGAVGPSGGAALVTQPPSGRSSRPGSMLDFSDCHVSLQTVNFYKEYNRKKGKKVFSRYQQIYNWVVFQYFFSISWARDWSGSERLDGVVRSVGGRKCLPICVR